ncbi:MAG: cytochrome c3 family protein [Acidobacteriia bacterium]|nr:cytochrome c3 family protein [Terriglobia bacterium]
MRIILRSAVFPAALFLMLAGCSGKPSDESSKSESAKPQATQAETQSTSQGTSPAAKKAPEESKAVTPEPLQGRPSKALPVPSEEKSKTVSAEPKKLPTQDVFMLRDSPLGVVRFEHKLHQERAAQKCETCHHASRAEKPAKAAQQNCFDCHTKPPQPGMKTGRQAAFHNPTAQAGTCIECHRMQNAQGKKAPTKCMECHKKENT